PFGRRPLPASQRTYFRLSAPTRGTSPGLRCRRPKPVRQATTSWSAARKEVARAGRIITYRACRWPISLGTREAGTKRYRTVLWEARLHLRVDGRPPAIGRRVRKILSLARSAVW